MARSLSRIYLTCLQSCRASTLKRRRNQAVHVFSVCGVDERVNIKCICTEVQVQARLTHVRKLRIRNISNWTFVFAQVDKDSERRKGAMLQSAFRSSDSGECRKCTLERAETASACAFRNTVLHCVWHSSALPEDNGKVQLRGAAVGALHHSERRLSDSFLNTFRFRSSCILNEMLPNVLRISELYFPPFYRVRNSRIAMQCSVGFDFDDRFCTFPIACQLASLANYSPCCDSIANFSLICVLLSILL